MGLMDLIKQYVAMCHKYADLQKCDELLKYERRWTEFVFEREEVHDGDSTTDAKIAQEYYQMKMVTWCLGRELSQMEQKVKALEKHIENCQ